LVNSDMKDLRSLRSATRALCWAGTLQEALDRLGFVQAPDTRAGAAFRRELEAETARLASFLGAEL